MPAASRSTTGPTDETLGSSLSQSALTAALQADYITFTSSSTVRFFFEAAGADSSPAPPARLVSIGPITSQALRERGLEPHLEADPHDIDGVLFALIADAQQKTR